MVDLEAGNSEIRTRVRAQVPEFVYDDTAENFDEGVFRTCNAPAFFLMIVPVAAQLLKPGLRDQKIELDIIAAIVVQNLASRSAALKGSKGLTQLAQKSMKALHWWKPSFVLEKVRFRGADEPVREGSRMGQQLHFYASIYETYS